MLGQWWATVYDAGPTLNQHWANASFLLVRDFTRNSLQAAVFYLQLRGAASVCGPRSISRDLAQIRQTAACAARGHVIR